MRHLFSGISQATLNLVFPIYCQGCSVKLNYDNKKYLCSSCIKKIKLNLRPFCIRCGRHLNGDAEIETICADCINRTYSFNKAWQCCEYEGLAKELIHKFKYNKKLFLKDALVDILYNFSRSYIDIDTIDAIISTPMHRSNFRKRGFNQAALLSGNLSKILAVPYLKNALIKTKNTKKQITLNRKERLKNIKDCFCAVKGLNLNKRRLLLIDDVFTTGATANECSKVLMAAGAKSVSVLTVARGI